MRLTAPDAPLYDPRFEHDACGVGFVADAGGRRRADVLPLALAGLAALGHRGAFAADGESSDGAGVSLPLERGLLRHLWPGTRGRAAVLMLFLPADDTAAEEARAVVESALALSGLRAAAWRDVPVRLDALGSMARDSAPRVMQVLVPAQDQGRRRSLERDLLVARRRMETEARERGLAGFAVVSASSRTIVYKGLVDGERLPRLFPDLQAPLDVSYAVFHQRYATNTRPTWDLAQPFRLIAHNGEINTVRANRAEWRGRRARLGGSFGRRIAALGPVLSEHGSDSLSLDEALDLLTAAGWPLETALLATVPESLPLRSSPHPGLAAFQGRVRGMFAPWDGPAALVFADGRRVGALLDRNGLRPAAFTTTHDGLVAVASEAGAVPISAEETAHRGRLGPGEMLLVDPRAGRVWLDADAKTEALRRFAAIDEAATESATMRRRPGPALDRAPAGRPATSLQSRWDAGLDAERLRLSVRTMAIDGHEPTWSMGDDTPPTALGRIDRPFADHLRQAFAQVTNPAIDPERERVVMDLRVEVGRRPAPLGPVPRVGTTLSLDRPFVADIGALRVAFDALRCPDGGSRAVTLDATWDPARGSADLDRALRALVARALTASRRGTELLVLTDREIASGRLPIPSAMAVGAVHEALSAAGLRGDTDIACEAADVLDPHAAAMALAAGASVVCPWLAVELAAEVAGSRGAEELTPAVAVHNLLAALELGLRKTLARMGISAVTSYIGGSLFDVLGLDADVAGRCFPQAPLWPGTTGIAEVAARQLRRRALVSDAALPVSRLADTGFARYRADGETHLFAPPVVKAVQLFAAPPSDDTSDAGSPAADARERYLRSLERQPATVRDLLTFREAPLPVPLDDVESIEAITRRFVSAAMSLGSLSPEAHQAVTLGMRLAGGSSNTGEGGEDPSWYEPAADGTRRDAGVKQVASARFGVTARYLARAEQLEIKISQGSKPGEGGQLPGRKATVLIAALRGAQPGQSLISPPPHHDIYSIEDLAQLIADLRAINPAARIGVKLVASLGVGTIAAGVAKAGADYIQISGHAGGTGASPLSSIKHAGLPWEIGLGEAHQVLLRNDLRDRVALRTDGGLQTGRDVVIAALLGAEEFGFGTAVLVALGCDMARQCHLDTCPTGIATQREDLRAKFTGTPEAVARFLRGVADDARHVLASLGLRSIGQAIGETQLLTAIDDEPPLELSRLLAAPRWAATDARRASPAASRDGVAREPASEVESRSAATFVRLAAVTTDAAPPRLERPDGAPEPPAPRPIRITTRDRSFGAHTTGLRERGIIRRPVRWVLKGAAGQSFGAFSGSGVDLELVGQGNDYVGKGLSGGRIVLRPEEALAERAGDLAIAGNTCLYGATGGRLHVVGRAGMRFAIRNSGATAVVEGVGAHGCEYMTGGVVVILGPAGRNLGAGMTGGRAYLWDPDQTHAGVIDRRSVGQSRLSDVVAERGDGHERLAELRELLRDHRDAGSHLARRLLADPTRLADEMWLIEPLGAGLPEARDVRGAVDLGDHLARDRRG